MDRSQSEGLVQRRIARPQWHSVTPRLIGLASSIISIRKMINVREGRRSVVESESAVDGFRPVGEPGSSLGSGSYSARDDVRTLGASDAELT